MDVLGYCAAWPEELKDLSRRHYRLVCRVRNLESAIDRVSPAEFDGVMDQLEAARAEMFKVASAFLTAKWKWDAEDLRRQSYTGDETRG